jgi:hypothetical protein
MKLIKNKKASFQLTIPILIILFLLFAFIFGWFKSGGIVTFGEHKEDQTKTISCLGTSCELNSPYFGSITSGAIATIDGTTSYGGGWNVCGDNDGKVSIANSYSTNGNLILKSSASGRDGKSCNGNYINTKMKLPSGTLKIKCDLVASTPTDCPTYSYCYVDGIQLGSVVSWGAPPRFYIDGGTKTATISREYTFNELKDIEIKASGSVGGGCSDGSSYSSKITLEFIPLPVEEAEEIIEDEGGDIEGGENVDKIGFFQRIWNWIKEFFRK